MRTYIECLSVAAQAEGITIGEVIDNWFDNKYNEIFSRAAFNYTEQSNSHKHSVMQASGSDGVSGAAVGQRSVGTVAARGHIHKWHETSAKERICYMCGETEKTGAGSSHEGQP